MNCVNAGLCAHTQDSSDDNQNRTQTNLCCCFQERLRCFQERSVTDGSSNFLSIPITGTLFVFLRVAELFLLRAILETTVRRRFDFNLVDWPVPTLVYSRNIHYT